MTTTEFFNLSEMSRLTGINRAQLHKYVRTHGNRIPTTTTGKRTVFPFEAAAIFEEIRVEGLRAVGKKITPRIKSGQDSVRRRVGRPRLSTPAPLADVEDFLSLSAMSRLTGINRVQLHKYVRDHRSRIPSKRVGKRTVFPRAAADIFHDIRAEGLRSIGKAVLHPRTGAPVQSRPSSNGASTDFARLEMRLIRLEQAVDEVLAAIKRPIVLSVEQR